MKFFNSSAILIFFCLNYLNAQNTHKTWIYLYKAPYKLQGILYEVKDSSILVSHSQAYGEYKSGYLEKIELHINDIERIDVRKKNKKGKAALIGAFVGFAVGFGIGYSFGDDPPCTTNSWDLDDIFCSPISAKTKAFMLGIPSAFAGAGIGLAIGSIKIRVPINGKMKNYKKNKLDLKNFSIK